MTPKVLVESVSPNGNIEAFVEQYEDCCYFYLRGAPEAELPLRCCWVRNLRPAPKNLDVAGMKAGRAPMLPADACVHPEGSPPPRADELEIVWFEEGDAAALLEAGSILAIVPAWAGSGDFAGYARDCKQQHTLCWPLGTRQDDVLFARIERAREWWASWENGDPWTPIREGTVTALDGAFGEHTNYYAIDGGEWPPKAMVRFKHSGGIVLATCGVAVRPQPAVEMAAEVPSSVRRIELGLAVDERIFESVGDELMGYLSGQSNLPWHRCTWLGEGHTIPCDSFTNVRPGDVFTAMLLTAHPPAAPKILLPDFRGDSVTLLWMMPITEEERAFATTNGSPALLERLARAGRGWMLSRRGVVPPG